MTNPDFHNMNTVEISEKANFFRYAVVVEYIGTAYAGSQKQPDQRTIQSELESALATIVKSNISTIFSGRTDKGVHSKGQVVHFDLPFKVGLSKFMHSLNGILPSDISVRAMTEVDKTFHSQKSALYRWYRYIINNKPQRSVWLETIHVHAKLDVSEMNKALSFLIGKNDFISFKGSNSSNPARECIMYNAECTENSNIIYIDLVSNRFLYNMVRIIVGTLIQIGSGLFPAEHMLEVLNAKDRQKAGPTARPEGLTYMHVGYDPKYNLNDINMEAIKNENILCKA